VALRQLLDNRADAELKEQVRFNSSTKHQSNNHKNESKETLQESFTKIMPEP
jgi:hypothetical protein